MGRGWPQLLACAGVTLLAGCSGTRFGDQLARSFSAPAPSANGGSGSSRPAAAARTPAGSARPTTPGTATAGTPSSATASTTATATPAAQATRPAIPVLARPAPSPPAPYRVTIRLPAADPSAPAERVTEALRAAGVAFEVETIERMGTGGTGGTFSPVSPLRVPAPAPR